MVYTCVDKLPGPRNELGAHTVLKVAVDTLGGMVLDKQQTKGGCADVSNFFAQTFAHIQVFGDGELRALGNAADALLDLTVLAKDTLDEQREAPGYA